MMRLNDRGAYLTRPLDDGRVLDVISLTYDRARLTISATTNAVTYQNGW
jgi:hypothetical protein